MPYVFLTVAFVLNATANILLKVGARRAAVFGGASVSVFVRDPLVVLGVFAFALNAFSYFLALRHIAISVAYPIMVVMSLLIIDTVAVLVLHESLRAGQLVGYAAMVIGIVLVVAFGQRAA